MSRWLKVSCVLAAVAFVVGFRVHASAENAEPAQAAATLNAKRASADVARKPGSKVRLADVAALPEMQGEPRAVIAARAKKAAAEARAKELAKARAKSAAERRAEEKAERRKRTAERRKRAAERRKREAAADRRRRAAARKRAAAQPPAPRVVVTPVPTPVYRPPVYTPPPAPKKSYVGKDFDSKG